MAHTRSPEEKRELERLAETNLTTITVLGALTGPFAYLWLGKPRLALFNIVTLNWALTGLVTVPLHTRKLVRNARTELAEADFEHDEDGVSAESGAASSQSVTGSGNDTASQNYWVERWNVTRRQAIIGTVGVLGGTAILASLPDEEELEGPGDNEASGEQSIGSSNDQDTSGDASNDGNEDEVSELLTEWATLIEQNHGVEVLEINDASTHSWYFYFHTEGTSDATEYEIGAVADAYAWFIGENPTEAPENLLVYAVSDPTADPLSDEAIGAFYIEQEWARDWLDGAISDEEYVTWILATYETDPP
ncbi:hypothetical protein [Natronosalvus vescus]|uniref:hypothetical protein n=1 Tax=Natronosalvus vescus TaxID=2953881 RepID=UPI002091CB78|nr:hypothetical protein [Natronosalvus vescus]